MAILGALVNILKLVQLFLLLPLVLTVTSYSFKRTLHEPTFQDTPRNITVHMHEMARLPCRIKHLGPKQVAWRKVSMDYPLTVGTITFDPKEDITVSYKDLGDHAEGLSQWDLIIKRAQPRHSGMYECQISAKNVYTHYVSLKVLDTPLVVKPAISIHGTAFVNIHEPIRLVCNVTGGIRAPSSVDWFFDGHRIKSEDLIWRKRLHISDHFPEVPGRTLISVLTIRESVFEDKGEYVCRSHIDGDEPYTIGQQVSVLNTEKDHEKREEKNKSPSISSQQTENGGSPTSCSQLSMFIVLLVVMLK